MLDITDDAEHGCFILEPHGRLTQGDFDLLVQTFNEKVNTTDRIPNLIVHTKDFPGWADFAGFTGHLSFVRDHHKLIDKIALVSDARILDIAPRVARHFLFANIRHFPSGRMAQALDWVAQPQTAASHVTFMGGLPDDVVGISVHGVITARDYENSIVPLIEARLQNHAKIKLIYRIGAEFKAMTPGAVWSDTRVGIMHLTQFSKIAVVSDLDWIRHATRLFAPLIPGPVHVFADADLEDAKAWITSDTPAET